MLIKNLRIEIHSERDTLWNLLMDRIMNPETYLLGVTDAAITQNSATEIIREMRLHGGFSKERIFVDELHSEIRHELLEHPSFTGIIRTRIIRTARQSPVAPQQLEYNVEVLPKSRIVNGVVYGEAEIIDDIETEMAAVKRRAEKIDQVHPFM